MSNKIKYWYGKKFENQNENDAKEKLQQYFEKIFIDKIDTNVVFDFSYGDVQYDCVVFREEQILIFEIKDFSPTSENCTIDGDTNGLWYIKDSFGKKKSIDRPINPFEQVKIQRSRITSLIYDLNMSLDREQISRHIKSGIVFTNKIKIGDGVQNLLNNKLWFFTTFLKEFLVDINSILINDDYNFDIEFSKIKDSLKKLSIDDNYNDESALANQGLEELDNLNFQDAEHIFKNSIKLNSNNAYTWFNLAESFYGQEKYEKSLKASEKANSLKKNDSSILFLLGRCHFQLENYSEANIILAKVLELDPEFENIDDVESFIEISENKLINLKSIEPEIAKEKIDISSNFSNDGKDNYTELEIPAKLPKNITEDKKENKIIANQDIFPKKIISFSLTNNEKQNNQISNYEKINNAIKNNLKIQIKYLTEDFYPTIRIIVPFRTYNHGYYNYQYLDAFCEFKNENRTFRIDRIVGITITGESFKPSNYRPGNKKFMEKFSKSNFRKKKFRSKNRKLILITIILLALVIVFVLIYFFVIRK